MAGFLQTFILVFIFLFHLSSIAEAAPLNDFAVLQPQSLTGTDGAYVASHPDRRLGESIDVGQKLLLEKISGDGEARLFISNSSEQLQLQGTVSGGEGEQTGPGYDTNGDGNVTALDALLVINFLNQGGEYTANLDVNGDGTITALDALLVINYLNRSTDSEPESTPQNVGSPISNLPSVNVPNVRLIPDADVVSVGTVIMDFDIQQDLTRINFEGIGIDLTNRDGEAFVMNALYNAPGGAEGEIHIDVYSDETHHSRCVVALSDDTTGIDIAAAQAVVGVRFEDCQARGDDGGVNFSNVGALVLSINATRVAGAQFLISRFRTDSVTLCNVEDCGVVSVDPSIEPTPSPSPSSSPSASANASPSPSSSSSPAQSASSSPAASSSSSPSASASSSPSASAFPSPSPSPVDDCVYTTTRVSGLDDTYFSDLFGELAPGESGDIPSCFQDALMDLCPNQEVKANGGILLDDGCDLNDSPHWLDPREFYPHCWNPVTGNLKPECLAIDDWFGGAAGRFWISTVLNFLGAPRSYIENIYSGHDSAPWTDEFETLVHFDSNCNFIHPNDLPADPKLCGFVGQNNVSPISILLDAGYVPGEHAKLVEFKLDMHSDNEVSVWKASDKFPLLVFDPEDSNTVTSAKQLFGNYAFGGRTEDPMDFKKDTLREPWSNGFEALAVLDNNNDGEISGQELHGVKLWLDTNQNAEVDSGELKELSDFEITSLSYVGHKGVGKDLVIKMGASGKYDLVDWFVESFPTQGDAVSTFNSRPSMSSLEEGNLEKISAQASNSTGVAKGFTGMWLWSVKDKNGYQRPGVLVMQEGDRGDLKVKSLVEIPMKKNRFGISSGIAAFNGIGSVVSHNDGKEIQFTVYSNKSGFTSESTATLSGNGNILIGKSTQVAQLDTESAVSEKVSFDYEWKAIRLKTY